MIVFIFILEHMIIMSITDLVTFINDIKKDCYFDKREEVFTKLEILTEQLEKYDIPVPILNNLVRAMEKKDVVLIGDCLEYGLKPLLNSGIVEINLFENDLTSVPDIDNKIFYLGTYSQEPALCINNSKDIIRLNSCFSPLNEVEQWIKNINIKKTTTVVCLFGLGTGLFAEKILDKLPQNAKLIIDEPNQEIIDYCITSGDDENSDEAEEIIKNRLTRIIEDDRVVCLVEKNDDLTRSSLLHTALDSRDYIDMMGMVVVKHNNYDLAYPKGYVNFLRAIDDFFIKMHSNMKTTSYFKEKYMEDFMYNIFEFKKVNSSIDIEKILPKDIPVIIVSAGPSLKKNIEILKDAKGHSFIIAVDTAIRYLLENNVVPDITITLDPEKPDSYYPDGLSCSLPCMLDIDSNPQIVHRHTGRKFLFNSRNLYADKLCEMIGKKYYELSRIGGSVATAAFKMMINFGQKKIILVGQDLAYDNGKTHAGDADDGASLYKTEVDGVNGNKVITRTDWLGFLKWFERQIEVIKRENINIEIIDATEGGALIHGTKIMTLKEALDSCRDDKGNLPEYNFENMVSQLDYLMSEDEYNILLNSHREAIRKLKQLEIRAEEAIRICRNLLIGIENETISGTYVDKEKRRIYKINEECRKNIMFSVINEYVISDIIEDVGHLMLGEGNAKMVETNRINMLKISFESILDASIRIRERAKKIDAEKNK